MHSYSDEGIVIKRSDYGEADRLLTIYTLTHGKRTLIAKGVRKISSKRSGAIELFNHIKFSATIGKGDIDILGETSLQSHAENWRKHLGRITVAYQLIESVDKLTPLQEPHPEIFHHLRTGLNNIGNLNSDWQQTIKSWLIELLKLLGYVDHEANFSSDVYSFIESIASTNLSSEKLLHKLRYAKSH